MIAGHLQIKNDYYYMVLSYLDANGKRKQPWFPTGLPIKNNKKRAEKMNSTPFVRQYGILLTNGVLLYAKREAKQEIHRGV